LQATNIGAGSVPSIPVHIAIELVPELNGSQWGILDSIVSVWPEGKAQPVSGHRDWITLLAEM